MAASIGARDGREGSAKLAVVDQISQSVQSTANILHLMRQSSPFQVSHSLFLLNAYDVKFISSYIYFNPWVL